MAKDNTALQALAILSDTFSGAYQADVKAKSNIKIAELDREAKNEANQAKIFEYLIDQTDKDIASTETNLQRYQDMYQNATGDTYKIDELNRSGNAEKVIDSTTGSVLNSLEAIYENKNTERNYLQSNLNDIKQDIVNIGTVQNFYKGLGHSFEGGTDPSKWDVSDFSDDELAAYMSGFPELKGVESEPFMEGLKARQEAGLSSTIISLNDALVKSNLQDLKVKSQNIAINTAEGKINESQYDDLVGNLNRVVGPNIRNLYSTIVEPLSIQLASKKQSDVEDAEGKLINIGQLIDQGVGIRDIVDKSTGKVMTSAEDQFKELGTKIVSGIRDYKGTTDANFGKNNQAYFESMQLLHNYITLMEQQRDVGALSQTDYDNYITNIEFLTGPVERFMETYPAIEEAFEKLNDKALNLLIGDQLNQNETSIEKVSASTDPVMPEDQVGEIADLNINIFEPMVPVEGNIFEDVDTPISVNEEDEGIANDAITSLGFLETIKAAEDNISFGIEDMNPFEVAGSEEMLMAGDPNLQELPNMQNTFTDITKLTEFRQERDSSIEDQESYDPNFLGGEVVPNLDNTDRATINKAQDETSIISLEYYMDYKRAEGTDADSYDEFMKKEFSNYLNNSNIEGLKAEDYKFFINSPVNIEGEYIANERDEYAAGGFRLYPQWAFKSVNKDNVYKGHLFGLRPKRKGYAKFSKVMDEFRLYLLNKGM